MNTTSLFLAGLTLLASTGFAAEPAQVLTEKRIQPQRLASAQVSTGSEAGTISFDYSVTYSNSCVAGATTVTPISIPESVHSRNGRSHHHLIVGLQAQWRKRIACPLNYQPVTRNYHTVIRNLSAGESYDTQILGLPSRGETFTQIDVTAGK